MDKEIMVKESTECATIQDVTFGASSQDLMMDYKVPRILLQQGSSQSVAAGEAFCGDVLKSTTGEVLFSCSSPTKTDTRDILRVSKENPVRIIPLDLKLTWSLFEKGETMYEFRGVEPRNASNANLPYEFEQNGLPWKRYATIEVFALLEQDVLNEIEEDKKNSIPDISKMLLPVYFSFRSTSLNAGKEIASLFTNILNMRKKGKNVFPYYYSLPVWCEKGDEAKGNYSLWKASQQVKTNSEDVINKAASWFEIINKGSVVVDAEKEASPSEATLF